MSIIAHSTGTPTTFYGLIKMRETYEEYLNLMIGLGSFTQLNHIAPLNRDLIEMIYTFKDVLIYFH